MIGSGGREHALAWKLRQSSRLDELHAAPGNPGIAGLGECHPVRAEDGEGLLDLARALDADLVVVGPEAPLVSGVADELRHAGVRVFGPGREAARIEGSKTFAKEVMRAAGVPTAENLAVARPPCVVKVDGLAGGKGRLRLPGSAIPGRGAGVRRQARPAARDRGAAGGRGGVALRARRRPQRGRARSGPRLQANRRRRHRPEHRRHGRLLARRRHLGV